MIIFRNIWSYYLSRGLALNTYFRFDGINDFAGYEAAAHSALDSMSTRAGITSITSTGTQLLDDIKHQRRVELAFEGHRFADLVSWGDAEAVLGSKGYLETLFIHFFLTLEFLFCKLQNTQFINI